MARNGVICLGEALIDFIPTDETNLIYEKCPGGAPANVAAGLAKLGVKTAFVGKVGQDVLGSFLKETLTHYGVDVSQMILSEEAKTGLTFVTLEASGEREFDFYIEPSADQLLRKEELDEHFFKGFNLLHVGSISLIREPVRSATYEAIRIAKSKGMKLSLDPNVRLPLWESSDQARQTIVELLPQVDILKLSEEELTFLTGSEDIELGVDNLRQYGIPLIFVTKGANGSVVFSKREVVDVPALKVNAVDTTGAGDAFVSGILYGLNRLEKDLGKITQGGMTEIARLASVSGGLAASKKGAMTALPALDELTHQLHLNSF